LSFPIKLMAFCIKFTQLSRKKRAVKQESKERKEPLKDSKILRRKLSRHSTTKLNWRRARSSTRSALRKSTTSTAAQ